MSSTQIIIILKIFKDFFDCKTVLVAIHLYPENIQRLFFLQNCLSRKSSFSWKYSKVFCLQNCLRRKSSLSWKNSKTFSPAKLSSTQIIIILKIFKDFFDCKNVLFANFHYSENIQRLFRLQSCLGCKSSLSWKFSKTYSPAKLSSTQIIFIQKIFKDFFACKNVLATNHLYTENFQRLFFLQNCLRCNSSLSGKYSKTFPPAKLCSTQIIIILKIFKDFSPCQIVLDANHHFPENIQRLFCLQNCLRRKSSISWEYSKFHSPAKLSWPQIIFILKIFKDLFACKVVFDANHHYPETFQRLFRLQNCLSRNSSLSWKYSKTFFPAKLS